MAHVSPTVYLVWASLSVMLGIFLLFHLWSFDRFKCLKWNHGPHSSAFKRVMTYSYLLSVPLIITYAVGFAIIKCSYGFTIVPGAGIFPTPYQLWSKTAQRAILPLYLAYSIAWGLEMVTHLEELCFWFFLVYAGSTGQDWFRSRYFKIWAVGSCVAVLAMPLITILTRADVSQCEAYTFLAGGLGSLSLTIWFLPILWTFPSFLKKNGVEGNTLVRLTKFHELNCIRVVFRFLFTIPLVILGIDGVRPHQAINDKMIPTDLLGILAGIGCIISSGLTLVIFFPRSIEREMTRKDQKRARQKRRIQSEQIRMYTAQGIASQSWITISPSKADLDPSDGTTQLNASPSMASGLPTYEVVTPPGLDRLPSTKTMLDVGQLGGSIVLKPNRRNQAGDVELGMMLPAGEVEFTQAQPRDGNVNSLVRHWRSPIEIERTIVPHWQRQL